jgi:hypothetical protein
VYQHASRGQFLLEYLQTFASCGLDRPFDLSALLEELGQPFQLGFTEQSVG